MSESLQEETSKSRDSLADFTQHHGALETKCDTGELVTHDSQPMVDEKNAFSILMSPKAKEKGPRKRRGKGNRFVMILWL